MLGLNRQGQARRTTVLTRRQTIRPLFQQKGFIQFIRLLVIVRRGCADRQSCGSWRSLVAYVTLFCVSLVRRGIGSCRQSAMPRGRFGTGRC